jgi:DNA-binding NarL/FixJ family response regulator
VIRVVLADDQGMIRSGLRSLIDGERDMRVVAEAADGAAAVEQVLRHDPDVALIDIRMPVLDGISAARQIAGAGVSTRVLMLTTFDLDEYVFEALRAGAGGFVLKDAPFEELVAAIRVVAAGDGMLSPAVTRRVIEAFAAQHSPPLEAVNALRTLTTRETEVLQLIARGLSNHEIAQALIFSDATAKTHVSHVLSKLGLRDRVQAVIFAYECGLAQPRSPLPDT